MAIRKTNNRKTNRRIIGGFKVKKNGFVSIYEFTPAEKEIIEAQKIIMNAKSGNGLGRQNEREAVSDAMEAILDLPENTGKLSKTRELHDGILSEISTHSLHGGSKSRKRKTNKRRTKRV